MQNIKTMEISNYISKLQKVYETSDTDQNNNFSET